MRTIWQSLLWKEWHEHKWKLVSITAILWGVATLAMLIEDKADKLGVAFGMVTLCIVPLSVFVGAGAASNERSRRTLPFLQAVPVPMGRVVAAKVLFGVITLTVPLLLAIALFYLRSSLFTGDGRILMTAGELKNSLTGNWYLDAIAFAFPLVLSLFIWTAATGVNRRDEVSAGAVALGAMTAWYLLMLFLSYLIFVLFDSAYGSNSPYAWLKQLGMSTAAGGFVWPFSDRNPQWVPILVGAVGMHAALLAWYSLRFGRVSGTENYSPPAARRVVGQLEWLPKPHKSPFAAIVWKQFRESGSLALAGLAGLAGIIAVSFFSSPTYFLQEPDHLAELILGVCATIGCSVAIVVGIGVCIRDVSPGLNSFWRSIPINVDLWFWVKFVTGMLVLLAAMWGPLLVALFALSSDPNRILSHSSYGALPLVQIAVFSAAVAATCLVRQAIYAAILSIAATYAGIIAAWGLWFLAARFGLAHAQTSLLSELTAAQVGVGMVLSFIACTIAAWLATRHDWGRKTPD